MIMTTTIYSTKALEQLRLHLADLKAAPIFNKADKAEKTIDAALAVLVEQQQRIHQLEERLHHGN